ncbi:MAG TPA: YdbL family protein [Rhodanobacteraceae bacterium]|nr:YdbL family protein [Rhodanobacteraceae bacterium]
MRSLKRLLAVAAFVALAGCVTINVYFPAAAAEQAAQKFIGKVIGDEPVPAPSATVAPPAAPAGQGGMAIGLLDLLVPAAHAQTPDIRVSTPQLVALRAGMQARFKAELKGLLASGAIGFTRDGMVALRDPAAVPLAQRNQVRHTLDAENRDRAAVYREIAKANGHPEWEPKIRDTFAKEWIDQARAGWYYQNAAGAWQRK